MSFDSGLSAIDRYLHLRLNGDEWVAFGLKKLNAACNEASRLRGGLLFVPD